MSLAAVSGQVVEFPRLALLRDELPLGITNSAVALVLPDQRLVALNGFSGEDRAKTRAFEGFDFLSVEFRRVFGSGDFERGRHDVHQLSRLMHQPPASFLAGFPHARRPVRNEGRADAAFVRPVFVFAVRSVAHLGPAASVSDVGIRPAGHHAESTAHGPAVAGLLRSAVVLQVIPAHWRERRLVATRDEVRSAPVAFRATAVVLEIKNQRVLELPLCLQLSNDAPDALVHAVELRRVNLHATALERLVLHVVPLVGRRRRGPPVVEQAELLQLRPARRAHWFVAPVVAALVFRDVRILRVQRPVRSGERGVEEERLRPLLTPVLTDELHRLVCDGIGVVKLLGLIPRVIRDRDDGVVAHERTRIEVTARAVNRPVETIKSALQRPVVCVRERLRRLARRHVPLAHRVVAIPRRLQRFGDGDTTPIQVPAIAVGSAIIHHVPDARLMRMQPREQRRARGTASRRVVELGEAHAAPGERIQIRRRNLAAVTADVREPHVVRENDDDVGPGYFSGVHERRKTQKPRKETAQKFHGDAIRMVA